MKKKWPYAKPSSFRNIFPNSHLMPSQAISRNLKESQKISSNPKPKCILTSASNTHKLDLCKCEQSLGLLTLNINKWISQSVPLYYIQTLIGLQFKYNSISLNHQTNSTCKCKEQRNDANTECVRKANCIVHCMSRSPFSSKVSRVFPISFCLRIFTIR